MEKAANISHAIDQTRQYLSTEELASHLTLRPQSIRKRYCQTGTYYSLRPVKLPNGRLMWPVNSIELLAKAQ
ncbi:DNA-binding protein [Paraburkholderia acidisoli]|uniref:DNA-binding protein n=1 Tax=Paraburkholderia acidisoli TaxID=2571748 RepID=A0A7Z2GG02_9BURK|nr:DNA-binding protein [Paraburkholderia acidisoli]QGZ61080.1 DNA-binding protein [Paraburkholderia acidisoli]